MSLALRIDFESRPGIHAGYADAENFCRGATVADDYPAVLRQMKANTSEVLFVGQYAGKGATEDQFIRTFATAGKRVVFARDVAKA